jgi:hypothetical protein
MPRRFQAHFDLLIPATTRQGRRASATRTGPEPPLRHSSAGLPWRRDSPLEKRYTWRVFSALKWAFADFDDECVRLDLPHIREAKRTEMVRELEIRLQQMAMLLKVFKE